MASRAGGAGLRCHQVRSIAGRFPARGARRSRARQCAGQTPLSAPYRVVFAPEARTQLLSVYRYIEEKAGVAVADRFTGAIVDYCESFATAPRRGTRRDDLRRGLRTIGFRRRVTIAFGVDGEIVTIVGIFYGGQDIDEALQSD